MERTAERLFWFGSYPRSGETALHAERHSGSEAFRDSGESGSHVILLAPSKIRTSVFNVTGSREEHLLSEAHAPNNCAMYTNYAASHPILCLTVLLVTGLIVRVARNKYGYGISDVPGPFVASLTDLWRFFDVWGRQPQVTLIKLHQKHGKLVRIGPRTVSICDAEATQVIYALNSGFVKSEF
jgi:hypothetical protein